MKSIKDLMAAAGELAQRHVELGHYLQEHPDCVRPGDGAQLEAIS